MQKLLVICGPTATGKTNLGIFLAKKFNGEIVSADSRQVYKKMDIGTGKERSDDVEIYCYDVADPKGEFSISHYLKEAKKAIKTIYAKGRLPIVVGGTGFYIKGIVDGIPTVGIHKNRALRKQLSGKSVDELFEGLSQIDPVKAGSLNASDKKNPRRLIRAIEVAQYLIDHQPSQSRMIDARTTDVLFIGLSAPKQFLDARIDKRVDQRVNDGMKKEIENLLAGGVAWHDQSMFSLGYRQYRDYFEGGIDEPHVIDEWKKEERKYAKRQMVWFKKDRRINWFDISEPNYPKKVEKMVEKWHNGGNVS